jgi:REP element-mobilizing transposase RayT
MAQSLSSVLVHIIFSTKERRFCLNEIIVNELYRYIAGILKKCGCEPYQIGGTENHIHILCALSKNYALNKIVEIIKTGSSKWIKTKGEVYRNFYWQGGYGAFSISFTHKDVVCNYIANQKEHHKQITFEEELEKILKNCHVTYDSKYIWI